ncbi:elongation factor P--(R)-beta-lysine ligase [Vibrio viridaestus]|uniref:Elongation factor P--(R)-beta-lysine ligase n=1 Tax=Vibrio viridaestus TaxID=2487322 RepID=A0A3N9TBT7_9VIBR|nr:elongation factor P--(R)-beta-lysine ligase [Vibrio viridaestus]RQW61668.1 elongation factor P--(R)-beta-lysine ligase [Vibrio viridaestus]
MNQLTWKPSASIAALKIRAKIINKIREFFAEKDVLEVDTPTFSHATVTDIHLQTFKTQFLGPGYAQGQTVYMMTSPEFHMKRLLAAGSGSIYQMSKAFRNEECGRYHNPEFTMLEWYRVGFDHHMLMNEMDELFRLLLNVEKTEKMTYQQAFQLTLQLCPLTASMHELRVAATNLGLEDIAKSETNRDTLLQLLFSMGVENKIGQEHPVFVYNFPASQAALAKISPEDSRVAERFEVYFQGIELANGFHELDDASEQRTRFEQDNKERTAMGLPVQPIDEHLLNALDAGLPNCAGVAMGIDRLIMLATKSEHIKDVIAFDFSRS